MTPDLSVALGSLRLRNPILVASGTFGARMDEVLDVSRIGGVVEKTITLNPRTGNPHPRVWETPSGMLNSIGLDGPGLEGWIKKRYARVKDYPCALILSVSGRTVEEFADLVRRLDDLPRVDAFELNISCPNVSHGTDLATDPALTEQVVRLCKAATRRPVFAKLTPNVTDIVAIARAAAEGGADGLSAINTLKGMAVDWRRRTPCIGGVTGGLSGPAVKPVALRMVWEIASALPKIPLLGIGGISSADDALEFIVAGASAVQIGTASFVNAGAAADIAVELPARLASAGVARLADLVGAITTKAGASKPTAGH
jgi:dihydroorotate dehydrogenase (NAD+) catalytic subunit